MLGSGLYDHCARGCTFRKSTRGMVCQWVHLFEPCLSPVFFSFYCSKPSLGDLLGDDSLTIKAATDPLALYSTEAIIRQRWIR